MIPKRIRWMLLGAAVSYVSRRKVRNDVGRATDRIENALPPSVARVVAAMPVDLTRVGGAALVVGQGANRAARGAVVATRFAGTMRLQMRSARARLGHEIEQERRRLTSEAVRETEGEGAALEALLDLRPTAWSELASVPDPIATGRRRHRPLSAAAPVARVQRTYQRPIDRWHRRTR